MSTPSSAPARRAGPGSARSTARPPPPRCRRRCRGSPRARPRAHAPPRPRPRRRGAQFACGGEAGEPGADHHHVGLVCRRVGHRPDPTSLPCPVRMPPATRSAEREEERRLNTRTLTIASVASASAAAVTSQLWIAGTWIAAALTPVLVALLSEALHRPTERIARAWTSDQPALSRRAARPRRTRRGAPRRPAAAARCRGARARGSPSRSRAAPCACYRPAHDQRAPRRRIALGAVAATAAIAFVIAVVALTAGDLVSGGSIGKGAGRTTFFSGGASKKQQQDATPRQPSRTTRRRSRPTPEPTTGHHPGPGAARPPTPRPSRPQARRIPRRCPAAAESRPRGACRSAASSHQRACLRR